MRSIYLWFYCLPFPRAVCLLLVATALFLYLRDRWARSPRQKVWTALLLVGWLAAILFATLGLRTEGGSFSEPVLTPFRSYITVFSGGSRELLRANFMNTVLFYPAGLLGHTLLSRRPGKPAATLWLLCLLSALSIGIEFFQYRFGLGLAETDDVIHNTLGAALGILAASVRFRKPL